VSGRSRAESQVGVRLMGVWRVSYSNIQEFFITRICIVFFLLYLYFLAPATRDRCGKLRRPQARWRLVSWLYTWHLAMLKI
jgi:hypothetical protein